MNIDQISARHILDALTRRKEAAIDEERRQIELARNALGTDALSNYRELVIANIQSTWNGHYDKLQLVEGWLMTILMDDILATNAPADPGAAETVKVGAVLGSGSAGRAASARGS